MASVAEETAHYRFSLLLREIDNLRFADGVSTVALVLIQIDNMDEINQRFGYLGGDKVLREFALRTSELSDDRSFAFEITGTSFALLLQNPLHEGEAVGGAEKIVRVADDPIIIGSRGAQVSVRMGISMLPEPAATAEELLRQCELALYEARTRGESHCVFTPDISDATITQSWFDIEAAIKQGEIDLHYQPKMNLRTGRLIGAEALSRWQSPDAGEIAPGFFLPDVQHLHGDRALFGYVLDTALQRARAWVDQIPDFEIAVNLAPGNLSDKRLCGLVKDALARSSFPPRQLILEVNESVLTRNFEANLAGLNLLRGIGVRTSIDDFGTGFSSLTHLKAVPVNELKIDESFIANISTDRTDRQIAASVIQLAHALDWVVVAEGIESAEVMQTLLAMGCEVGHGFHFSEALDAEEFERQWVDRFARATL